MFKNSIFQKNIKIPKYQARALETDRTRKSIKRNSIVTQSFHVK